MTTNKRLLKSALVLVLAVAVTSTGRGQIPFAIQSVQPTTNGGIALTWSTPPGATNQVRYADSLNDQWQDLTGGLVVAGMNVYSLSFTDYPASEVTQRFYRIRTTARANVVMSLVLDWSGSMFTFPPFGSGGALGGYLTNAISIFIDNFDDNADRTSMVSFGSFAQVNVPMRYQFKSAIKSAVQNLTSLGRTFSDGGLTLGLQQIQSVPVNPGENLVKVIVFFTDGFANTFQENLNGCGVLNLGQNDPINNANGPWDYSYSNPTNGSGAFCNATTFYSIGGNLGGTLYNAGTVTIGNANQNIWREGQLRTLATANAARNAGIVIYSIGLGFNTNAINQTFLKQIANVNDPSNPTFNSSQPTGDAVFAPTAVDLESVFQQIASKALSQEP
jgi:hypothetical protein